MTQCLQVEQKYREDFQDLNTYPQIEDLSTYPFQMNEKEFSIINARTGLFENIHKYNTHQNKWRSQRTGCHYSFPFDTNAFDKTNQILYLLELSRRQCKLNEPAYVSLISLNLIKKDYVRDRIQFPFNVDRLASKAIIIENKLFITADYYVKSEAKYKLGIFEVEMIDNKINRYSSSYSVGLYADYLDWQFISSAPIPIKDNFQLLYNNRNNCLIFIGDSLLTFNLATDAWSTLETSLPQRISYSFCTLAVQNIYILIFGGVYNPNPIYSLTREISQAIYVYDLQKNKLTKSSVICPKASRYMGIVMYTPKQNELTVFGYMRNQWANNEMSGDRFPPRYLLNIIGGYFNEEYAYILDMKNEKQYKINVFDIIYSASY